MDGAPLVAPLEDIVAARRGDRDAMGRLWRTYQPQILRFLRSRRCVDADDVASQVWIDVARSFERFDGDGIAFQRWVFTIARNRSIDLARRRGRRNETELPVADSGDVIAVADVRAVDPAVAVSTVEEALALVGRLPVAQAEAVMLRVVADLSVSDVAEITGESEANVRVLTHRGVSRLRRLLGADGSSSDASPSEECVTNRAGRT